MKILVIEDSQYGASRRYAQWIADQTGARLLNRRQVRMEDLEEAEVVIYGAGIYAGVLSGGKWLAGQQEVLAGKELAIFACGMLDPQSPGAAEQVRRELSRVLPQQMMDRASIFSLRGAMDYSRMSAKHRAMMAGLRLFLLAKGAKRRTPADQMILDAYGKALDLVDEPSASPLSAWADGRTPYELGR